MELGSHRNPLPISKSAQQFVGTMIGKVRQVRHGRPVA
jgi:hypothetical protein